MADAYPPCYAGKSSIVQHMFMGTADENYVVARLGFINDLTVDFFWNAVHCTEKYLKAALLMNGKSGKGRLVAGKRGAYGHDIRALFADVRPLAPELIPEHVTAPPNLEFALQATEAIDDFVARLYDMGNEHNRYQLTGYVCRQEDLFKLDQLVFAIRRLCRPLECHFLGTPHPSVPDQSLRERTEIDHPFSARFIFGKFERICEGSRGQLLQDAALNCNFPFGFLAPKGYEHPGINLGFSSVNPVLVRRLLDPLDSGDANQEKEADELWDWVSANIYLPPSLEKAYKDARATRKAQGPKGQ